jgi:hypothetical protein
MDNAKIFIASSGRTLVLAEKLQDELRGELTDATLWSEEGRRQTGRTIYEMLQSAAERYDFAVIILAKDDVVVASGGEARKARDNCVFEAGLFMASIGRERCFLVHSVSPNDLPSDLGGIISIPFDEPADLTDRLACATAIASAAANLKDIIQRMGPRPFHDLVPLLSVDEVFKRERPHLDGGDLVEGQVVVCDTQPWAEVGRAELFRRNIDNGTAYHCFFSYSEDTIEKICLTLQMVAWAGVGEGKGPNDFRTRTETITREQVRVLSELRDICESGRLRFSLMTHDPTMCFRVHNASNPNLAKFYANYRNKGFALWEDGLPATQLWISLPTYLEVDTMDRLFLALKTSPIVGDQWLRFEKVLDHSLGRYFPGVEAKVKEIILGPRPW